MIVNPFTEKDLLQTYAGTRILQHDFGLIGLQLPDFVRAGDQWVENPNRAWVIQGIYAPIRGRSIQGIRARVMDDRGFSSFVNQVDLEFLHAYVSGYRNLAGKKCEWTGRKYSEPGDNDWFGMCMDDNDLADDLHARENFLRGHYADNVLPENSEIRRRIHLDDNDDREEQLLLLWDGDFSTGESPDFKLETIKKRWASVAKERVNYITTF